MPNFSILSHALLKQFKLRKGDSGGPMYKIDGDKQILAGIVSWGQSDSIQT